MAYQVSQGSYFETELHDAGEKEGYELKHHIFSNIVKTNGLNYLIGFRSESAGRLFYLS